MSFFQHTLTLTCHDNLEYFQGLQLPKIFTPPFSSCPIPLPLFHFNQLILVLKIVKMCYSSSHGSSGGFHFTISQEAKPSNLETNMQRIRALPPVITARLHNKLYCLDVWTLWSTVLQDCSSATSRTSIRQALVPNLLLTLDGKHVKEMLGAPLAAVPGQTQ